MAWELKGVYKVLYDIASDGKIHWYKEFSRAFKAYTGKKENATSMYLKSLLDHRVLVQYGRGLYGIPGLELNRDQLHRYRDPDKDLPMERVQVEGDDDEDLYLPDLPLPKGTGRRYVLQFLKDGRPKRAVEIVRYLFQQDYPSGSTTIVALCNAGYLDRVGRGVYQLSSRCPIID